ncbi:hypothetical protein Tco_0719627 [Tanacetum coccineum]
MHNNIMAAGSRDRPPMLVTGRYAQWRSRFLRYVDTRPNGDALRKCILEGPYTPTPVIIPAVPATDNSPAVPEQTTVETILNMSLTNKTHFESEKERFILILTGIGDEIYSTVDACKTAHEMWEAIERLQQGESLNIQDVKTNLFWEFGQFTSHDGETIALVATAQTLQDSYTPTSKASLPSRSHATTRHKGKKIVKPIILPSESASEEDSDPEQAQKYKDMQEKIALISKIKFGNQRGREVVGARTHVGGQVVQQSVIQLKLQEYGHFAKECEKPKWLKTPQQSDWLVDTNEEIDEQELEAHYSYMAKIQEVPNEDSGTDSESLEQVQYDSKNNVLANEIQHFEQSKSISDTCVVETDDSNVIPNSPNMCDNDIQNDQNDVECDDERVALANLIANLKLDIDENKKIQNQLKKANATLN